ncbi:MAG: PepSY domain-containing protein [Gammaproteobacteria bacterium]|nr:PepSY domain-containing protein [Gammaproteobacteria bacterium]
MRRIHRILGATIALFVLLLASTGILLNHTTDLNLDQRYLTWNWLLNHYGVTKLEPDAVFLIDNKVISQFGQQLFVDATPVVQESRPLKGGISQEETFVVATDQALLIFTEDGEFVEKMTSSSGVPAMIQNIGLYHGEPVVQTRDGLWRSDFMLERWERLSLQGVGWSVPEPMPASVAEQLQLYFHGQGISIERVVLDLHNGHIFGQYGPWLLDGIGALLLILSLTGIWMWAKRLG